MTCLESLGLGMAVLYASKAYQSGASFIGMRVTYVQQMRSNHREGHSWVLDTATARVCLMSQRADGRLMRATAPHAAGYFYFSQGPPRHYRITSCPCTHPRQRLSLEVTDFEAGWPVIDFDFK